jgi:hypothetical protein
VNPSESLEQAPPRRSRIYLAVAAAAVLIAAAAAVVAFSSGGDELRFEIETTSGTARQIQWNTETGQVDTVVGTPGESIPTPWSTTVSVDQLGLVTLKAMSGPTDTVTCRIIANGKIVAEGSRERALACVFDPNDAMP